MKSFHSIFDGILDEADAIYTPEVRSTNEIKITENNFTVDMEPEEIVDQVAKKLREIVKENLKV